MEKKKIKKHEALLQSAGSEIHLAFTCIIREPGEKEGRWVEVS